MRNHEEAIDKVLAALRTAKADPEMERRIVRTLRDHASAGLRSRWSRWRPDWLARAPHPFAERLLVTGAAFAVVLAVALATRPAPPRSDAPAVASETSRASSSLPVAASNTPAENTQHATQPTAAQIKDKPGMQRRKFVHEHDDTVAGESRAASFPAPPLPLTQQEQLLLRIAHRANPEQVAPDTILHARQEAQAKAEFHYFFEPAPIKENN